MFETYVEKYFLLYKKAYEIIEISMHFKLIYTNSSLKYI